MTFVASRRVDPRALLRSVESKDSVWAIGRGTALSLTALIGLGAFGAVVVKAQEDSGVLAFIRTQSRPVAEARPFYPTYWGRSADRQVAARPQSVAIAYAPAQPLPGQVRLTPPDARAVQPFIPTSQPRRAAKVNHGAPAATRGTGVAYCVRTCDGFFFPLGPSTGSAAADEKACATLCPATETRVYHRRVGEEMDTARARRDGSLYAALPAAFTHRNSYKAACSCTGQGVGLSTGYSARYDQTLRAGDAVMTGKGVMVFNGGTGKLPYRDSSFTALNRSDSIDNATRDVLRRHEQASIPGRSGLPQKPLPGRSASAGQQLVSASSANDAGNAVRDVAPGVTRRY